MSLIFVLERNKKNIVLNWKESHRDWTEIILLTLGLSTIISSGIPPGRNSSRFGLAVISLTAIALFGIKTASDIALVKAQGVVTSAVKIIFILFCFKLA